MTVNLHWLILHRQNVWFRLASPEALFKKHLVLVIPAIVLALLVGAGGMWLWVGGRMARMGAKLMFLNAERVIECRSYVRDGDGDGILNCGEDWRVPNRF